MEKVFSIRYSVVRVISFILLTAYCLLPAGELRAQVDCCNGGNVTGNQMRYRMMNKNPAALTGQGILYYGTDSLLKLRNPNGTIDTLCVNCGGDIPAVNLWDTTGLNLFPTNLNYNVGIGTATPTGKFHVVGAATISTSTTTPLVIGGTTTTSDLNLKTTSGVGASGADMHFLVGNNGATEAMTILNNGRVGIGTIAPTAKLHVVSDSAYMRIGRTGSYNIQIVDSSSVNGYYNSILMGTSTKFCQILSSDGAGQAQLVQSINSGNPSVNLAGDASNGHSFSFTGTVETSGVDYRGLVEKTFLENNWENDTNPRVILSIDTTEGGDLNPTSTFFLQRNSANVTSDSLIVTPKFGSTVMNIRLNLVPAYDDDAAAGVAGLTTGDLYQTTGGGAAPLDVPGLLLLKQ